MKSVFLLLALAGLTCGLTSNLEYIYKYSGIVSMGINEFSPQSAGTAIKALIVIQVHEDGSALIKLKEVQFAEFNDELGCDSRGNVPGSFQQMTDEKLHQLIETPFKAHYFDTQKYANNALDVDDGDLLWLSNIRKAIVSHLKIKLLKGNFMIPDDDEIVARIKSGKVPRVFHIKEETIFGECTVDYTTHQLREDLAYTRSFTYGQEMEEDVERGEVESSPYTSKTSQKTSKTGPSKTSKTTTKTIKQSPEKLIAELHTPKIQDALWHVVRSIDFNDCSERVFLQTSPVTFPMGTQLSLGDGQYEWIRGRSSVSEYILRGSGGHFRVERAVVEGSSTFAPLGIKTELLQSRTNQTFQLVAVRRIKTALSLPKTTKPVSSWMQSVLSFAEYPKYAKAHPWIVYPEKADTTQNIQTYGIESFTEEETNKMKELVIKNLENASNILTDTDQAIERPESGVIVQYLQRSSHLMAHLSKEQVQDILNTFFAKNTRPNEIIRASLAVDTAAASGSYYAIEAVIDSMKAEKIPAHKIMTFFMTMTNHVECPGNIPSLMDYVLSLDFEKHPFLTSTVFINFANFLQKMCYNVNSQTAQYPVPLFGDYVCDKNKIVERFHSHLEQIIQGDEDTPLWKKEIAIDTLTALGFPISVPILTSVALGEGKCSDRLRRKAIYALGTFKFDQYEPENVLKETLTDLLTDIYTNVGEKLDMRQAALMSIDTWEVDTSFWYKLARTTWREPSRRMASLMVDILYSHAKLVSSPPSMSTLAASHAIKFARPIAPSAKKVFYNQFYKEKKNEFISQLLVLSSYYGKNTQIPRDFYFFMWTQIGGGLELTELEVDIEGEGSFDKFNVYEFEKRKPASGVAMKVAQRFYKSIQETLSVKPRNVDETPNSFTAYLKIFEHMKLALPLFPETTATAQKIFDGGIPKLTHGYDLTLGKFFNPIKIKTFEATELGIPLFAKMTNPMVLTGVSVTKVDLGIKAFGLDALMKLKISSDLFINFASKSTSSLEILVPWSRSFVGTGINAARDVIIPMTVSYRGGEKSEGDLSQQNYHVDFKPNYTKKYPVIRASNVPFTRISPIVPALDNRKSNWKPIVKSDLKQLNFKLSPPYTGLNVDIIWRSDIINPIKTLEKFVDGCREMLGNPLLLYSIVSPTIKIWNLQVNFDPEASETKSVSIECGKTTFGTKRGEDSGQFTQEKGDYDDLSQTHQAASFDQYDQENVDQGLQEVFDGSPKIPAVSKTSSGKAFFGDSFQKRSEKLQQQFASGMESASCKLEFGGTNSRSFELMMTTSKPVFSSTMKLVKRQWSFVRGPIPGLDPDPLAVYLDIKTSSPAISPLDTWESLLSSNSDSELQAEITVHPSEKPIASLKGNFHLSSAWKERYNEEIKELCDFDSFDLLHAFHSNVIYDLVKLTFSYEKVCDFGKLPMLTIGLEKFDQTLTKYLRVPRCDATKPPKKMTFDMHRCPISDKWFIDIERGDYKFVGAKEVEAPPLVTRLLGIGSLGDIASTLHHYPDLHSHPKMCAIRSTKLTNEVRTFDGLKYNLELSDCWTVAVHDCSKTDGWFLLVRSSSGDTPRPEVKYVDIQNGILVEITDHVIVNGKTINPVGDSEAVLNDDEEVIATVSKKGDFYSVEFSNEFYIAVKDDLQIKVPQWMQGSACGICGNYDGEPEAEFIGPHGCIYGSPKEFAASWTTESDSCNLYTLQEKRHNVESYQEKCTTIDAVHDECPNYDSRGTHYKYLTFNQKDLYCVSKYPLPLCEDGVFTLETPLVEVACWCWNYEQAPKPLIEASTRNGTLTTRSFDEYSANVIEMTASMSITRMCLKN